jgi:hypothetical protein
MYTPRRGGGEQLTPRLPPISPPMNDQSAMALLGQMNFILFIYFFLIPPTQLIT